jgi:hypothetical protein
MIDSAPRTLSQLLRDAVNDLEGEKVTLQEISDQLGVRAYGAFIVLLAFPSFIPGISLLSGIFLLVFSMQMAMGIERPWLPKFIRNVHIQISTLEKGLNLTLPQLAKIEHYIKPRILFLSSKIAIRLIGLAIAFFSFVVLLPIPFGNFIPAIALLFVAFGMLQRDGLLTLCTIVLGAIYCVAFLWFAWSIILRLVSLL